MFILHGGVIDYLCKKTVNTPLSSTEAEWYAACTAATAGKKLRHLLEEIGFSMTTPLVIFEDNKGCISFGYNSGNRSTMTHIETKYWFLCEEIENNNLALQKSLQPTISQTYSLKRFLKTNSLILEHG